MIDIKTYQQLHPESAKFSSGSLQMGSLKRKEIAAKVADCDVPPQGPELFALPSTLIGYNLQQKKWRTLITPTYHAEAQPAFVDIIFRRSTS